MADEDKTVNPPNSPEGDYTADNIQVLEGLSAVRKRPAMYIGSTGPQGLHHLVYEVVDNSIDEALAGFCTRVDVIIHADERVSIRDHGRVIPVDMHPTHGKRAHEVLGPPVNDGAWHHLVGTFDGRSVRLYTDLEKNSAPYAAAVLSDP